MGNSFNFSCIYLLKVKPAVNLQCQPIQLPYNSYANTVKYTHKSKTHMTVVIFALELNSLLEFYNSVSRILATHGAKNIYSEVLIFYVSIFSILKYSLKMLG